MPPVDAYFIILLTMSNACFRSRRTCAWKKPSDTSTLTLAGNAGQRGPDAQWINILRKNIVLDKAPSHPYKPIQPPHPKGPRRMSPLLTTYSPISLRTVLDLLVPLFLAAADGNVA